MQYWTMMGNLNLKDRHGTFSIPCTTPETIRAFMAEQQERADRITRDNQRLQDYLDGKYVSHPDAMRF